MLAAFVVVLRTVALICCGHRAVALENLALRQQLAVFRRNVGRPPLRHRDRLFRILLAKAWREWRTALIVVQPDTVVRWHRQFRRRIATMGIREVISAPSSPWQNPYVERLIGSIRRECLDHVIVFNKKHLRRTLTQYLFYCHGSRTHLSLAKDAPTPRRVQAVTDGDVMAFPEVGGLQHRYERRAA
jgi:hypothetical protein